MTEKPKIITPCYTLEMMDYPLYKDTQALIHAYFFAGGKDEDGARFAALPETWENEGVYLDFDINNIDAFLSNADGDVLICTDCGIVKYYFISDILQGTFFDILEILTDAGGVLSTAIKTWDLETIKQVFFYLEKDLPALKGAISEVEYQEFEALKAALSSALIDSIH